ncbi:hypothetical protein, partial [uncultured Muribaculum sp.]|uniref:hypothetical protein n=2 Tax=uncultured Muribaculum sp. TaxID=1918613 RepID=UPI00263BDC1E
KALIDKELNPCRDKSLRGHKAVSTSLTAFLLPKPHPAAFFLKIHVLEFSEKCPQYIIFVL